HPEVSLGERDARGGGGRHGGPLLHGDPRLARHAKRFRSHHRRHSEHSFTARPSFDTLLSGFWFPRSRLRREQSFARFEINAVRPSSPAAFLFAFRSRRAPPPWWWGITEAQASRERGRYRWLRAA